MKAWSFCAVVLLGSLIFANVCSSTFYPTDADLRWRYRNLNVNPVYTQTFSQAGADALLEQRRFAVRTAPGERAPRRAYAPYPRARCLFQGAACDSPSSLA